MPVDRLIPLRPATGRGWTQVTITFPHWAAAEDVAVTRLVPLLRDRPDAVDWWFVRKHPTWRLRYRPAGADTDRSVAAALDALAASSTLSGWNTTVYEPEQLAFGGTHGMAVAHRLFHHDSCHVLQRLRPLSAELSGRRELSVVTATVLLRAAGLDWYEQGDVWAALGAHRPARPTDPASTPTSTAPRAMRRLLTLDTTGPGGGDGGTAEHGTLASWLAGFHAAGTELAVLVHSGRLHRGLRAVLVHHVVFHWNRLGLPYSDQRSLAVLARDVVLHSVGEPARDGTMP